MISQIHACYSTIAHHHGYVSMAETNEHDRNFSSTILASSNDFVSPENPRLRLFNIIWSNGTPGLTETNGTKWNSQRPALLLFRHYNMHYDARYTQRNKVLYG